MTVDDALTPRLRALPREEWPDELIEVLGPQAPGGGTLNIFATLAHHPKLMKRWLVFGNHVLAKSTLPPRDRELLILRTGWRCSSPYEWGQHVVIARALGVDDVEIARIASGPDEHGWSEWDALLLRAADELHDRSCITESTWRALAARYDEQQLLDLVFCVGQYHIVSMALNSCRVERDDGVDELAVPFPVHPDATG
jgi:4-carboxymuconolactone decarboxylase